ncbi:cell division protein FtsQ [Bacillus sp. FJAT-27225]|uniref:cell division protein FtsQ/DivIB n=1 Tax=Bacillus sp. FJAT-27225 TaxID=1743144 RepID=UPI00080C2FAE|nr:FtsQ-type POTRA domain-containing protein [Bacillus sp. FJAT-27225]OCA85532.1 cell division protein FtsQ [Bacillus sp. FJAT-27225]
MQKGKVLTLEDRIPKLKEQRRKKANRRLILLLFMFFLLILCVIYIQSPLSHVKTIEFRGNEAYTDKELALATEISTKTNIWKVDKQSIEQKLMKLPELKEAEVSLKLPNTVMVNVREHRRIAYIVKDSTFYPVMENGTVLKGAEEAPLTVNAPVLAGFKDGKILDEMCKALVSLPAEVYNTISEIHYTPQKTDKFHISLFMNDGFEVSASLRTFADKMIHYPSIASQLDPKVKGVIDLEVGSFFRAYEKEEGDEGVEEAEGEG